MSRTSRRPPLAAAEALPPPADPEAEQAVLGAILVRPQVLPAVASQLSPASFYREAHRHIFQTMLDLMAAEQPVDLVTVTALLRDRQQLEGVGGPVFLAALSEAVGFAANAGHYAARIKDKQVRRELAGRAREIYETVTRANGDSRTADLLLFAESQIQDSIQDYEFEGPVVISAPQLLEKDFSEIFKNPIIGGGLLLQGCGLMIAGESGEGKSMLRLELALHLAIGRNLWGLEIPRARRVLIIQFENIEPLEQLRLRRMLKGLEIKCPDNLMFSTPLGRFNLGEEADQARLMAVIRKYKAEVVIYDPLSSLHVENENDNAKMRSIMDNLTQINRRTGATGIVIHHYGKPGKEEVGGQHRTRGASSIRDWADTLWGFSRRNSSTGILKNLDFLKVRCGPEPKPLILERDQETFLTRLSEGDGGCSPAKVAALLDGFGGQAERDDILRVIQNSIGCQRRKAEDYLASAVTYGYVHCEEHPMDSRKKIFKVN